MKAKHRLPLCGTSALAFISSISGAALAAEDTAASRDVQEVVVTGVRQALRDSIAAKKNSELISDNISTADIGQLPDVTIAEELNRLPGVNTTRDRGNASQAAVRGLGPRLVLGLVNGREVASSEPSQDLRWEIYPSEVLSGASVYKSQDASLIPGGIAATIDIRTLSPLDYHGPTSHVARRPHVQRGRQGPAPLRSQGLSRQRRLRHATSRTTSPSRLPRASSGRRTASRMPALSAGTR